MITRTAHCEGLDCNQAEEIRGADEQKILPSGWAFVEIRIVSEKTFVRMLCPKCKEKVLSTLLR